MDFFPKEHLEAVDKGFTISLKASVALDILRTHPLIIGTPDGEDSAGRQRLRDSDASEVLDRVFALADGYVERCVANGWIKPTTMDPEVACTTIGKNRGMMERAQYDRQFTPKTTA